MVENSVFCKCVLVYLDQNTGILISLFAYLSFICMLKYIILYKLKTK